MFVVGGQPQIIVGRRGVRVFHKFDADDERQIEIPRANGGGGRVQGHRAGSAGRFVARRGHTVKHRVHFSEERAQMTLGEKLRRREIADVRTEPPRAGDLRQVSEVKARVCQARLEGGGQQVGQGRRFPRPVAGEIALSAAQNRHSRAHAP